MSRDWDAWARDVERRLDVAHRSDTDFQDLFASDAVFIDPTQTKSTDELPQVSKQTQSLFPDWTQEVTSIRGDEDWAVFEWIGRGTFTPRGETAGRSMEMFGVTLVDVDGQGRVTQWRDYFDMKSVEDQLRGGSAQAPT